jgi:hypothetical protein
MTLLHGNPPASLTDIFHSSQFILAHMLGICLGRTTKTAFRRIPAGVTEMTRFISQCTTILTSICHDNSPFIGVEKLQISQNHYNIPVFSISLLKLESQASALLIFVTVRGRLSGQKHSVSLLNPSMSQNTPVTCLHSPAILSLWPRIFSVRPLGRYL